MPYIIEKTFNSKIFTKVGNPTITADGIASRLTNNNHIQLNNSIQIGASSNFKVDFQFTVGDTWVENWIFQAATANNFCVWIGTNNLDVYMNNVHIGNLHNGFAQNGSYKGYLKREGRIYTIYCENLKTHTSKIKTVTATEDYSFSGALWIGKSGNSRNWSTDLKQFKITVDGKVVLNGTTSKEIYVLPSIQELKDYYSNTLIVQYNGKPKAKQTIEMLVYLVFSEMLLFQVQNAFNWKTAVGKQLDVIGQWVGVSRTFNINLLTEPKLAYPQYDRLDPDTTSALQGGYSDYESFDTLQGGQLRYSDIQTTTNNLNDDNYRIIIGLKIIFNSINHTAKAIDDAIWEYFNHEVYTVWTDNTLTYYYPSNLAQVMLFADYKGVLPAPTGVTVQLTEI